MMLTLTSSASLPPRSAGTEKDNNNPTHEKSNDDENAKFLVRGHIYQPMICAGKDREFCRDNQKRPYEDRERVIPTGLFRRKLHQLGGEQ
jgi:hypothetical protein